MRNTGSWSKAWQVMMLPSFSPLFFASCSGSWWGCVCPSQNIRSSWWMVTPLLFYFFLLGTVGAYSGILSTENTWLLFPWERFLFPVTFYFHPQLDQRKERRKEAFFFFPLSFMLSLQSVDSPPTLSVGRIHSSLAVSERQPWSQRLPRSSAFHPSTHSLEITRLILYKLRASSVLKTTGALTAITVPLGNSCKS